MQKYTNTTFALGNEEGALNDLSAVINFQGELKPSSQMIAFYQDNDWHYTIIENAKDGNRTCIGTFSDEEFELVFSLFTIYGGIVTASERELGHVLNALTDIVQDDHTMVIKVEDAIRSLVHDKYISASAGDKVNAMLSSRGEY
ncbi:hypothetical protein [Paenibacillus tianjinensis]|uniref:Uncharacterized protein n=1 Tax=Paenibacillus tianjinensis TaxID=2810347 RepID=A0ABX7L7C9_9BACL|nr:hypothetical protein [Paenibacillus tianjinensis]QSF43248.1 hypothetical protein JRJ22_18450 [Paenibacillus tianjinensis]